MSWRRIWSELIDVGDVDKRVSHCNSFREALRVILGTELALDVETEELDEDVVEADLEAIMQRDPAAFSAAASMLFYKGFKAVQAYRISHLLWKKGTKEAIIKSLLIQSRISQVYSIDVHPGAEIGRGFVLDHGTGTVIGETAVIGPNCTLMHGVTLGSSGSPTRSKRRHPTLLANVFVGAGATLLGDITIGPGSKIGAGAVVTKSFPLGNVTLVGNPAAPLRSKL